MGSYLVSSAGKYVCLCLSSDHKPANPPDNSVVIETDTGRMFYSRGFEWVSFGSTLYPVGSVYLTAVNTSPGTLLGFGTWASTPLPGTGIFAWRRTA